MKKIIFSVIILFSVSNIYSQFCETNVYAVNDTIACNDSTLIIFGATGGAEDFNCLLPNGSLGPCDPAWSINPGVDFSQPYIPSPDGNGYLWMGNTISGAAPPTGNSQPRIVTSPPYDASCGGQICFDFVYAVQSGASPTEGPDLYNEGISLQYNTGSGWVDMQYWAPNGTVLTSNPGGVTTPSVSGATAFTTWQDDVCVAIPALAQVANVQFRFAQIPPGGDSGFEYDHWGIDDISVSINSTAADLYMVSPMAMFIGTTPDTIKVGPTDDSTLYTFNLDYGSIQLLDSVTIYTEPTDAGPDLLLDCNTNIVQLQATGILPNGNYTWTPPNFLSNPNIINPTASPLDTTDYIFTSACGVDTMTVNVVSNYSFSTSDDTTICAGDTAYLEVYGGAQTYAWSPNDGSVSDTTIANPIFTPTATTTYTITTDSAGCIKTNNITIHVSNKNFSLFFMNGAGCAGGTGNLLSVAIGGLGALNFALDSASTIINQSNGVFSPLPFGTYTLTVTDSMSACPIDSTFTISGGISIQIDSVYSTNPLCVGDTGGSIEVFIDTNVVAMYSLNGGTPQTSNIFTGLTDGIYNIAAQFGTCPAATAIDTLSAPATVDAVFIDSTDLTCNDAGNGEISVSAVLGVAPYTYSLDNINFQTDSFFTSLDAGTYVVYAMDDNGCRDSITTSIAEPLTLVLNNVQTNPTLCFGDSTGSISFDVTNGVAPFQYSIDSGLHFQSTNNFNLLPAGAYILLAKDTNGCFSNAINDTIFNATPVVLVEDSTSSSTCGAADGIIYVSATGGDNSYTYSIDSGATFVGSGTFTGLVAGLYSIIVNDGNNCSDNLVVSVADFGAPTVSITSFDSVSCFGGNDASVQLSASGGTAPYQFSNGGVFQNDSLFTSLSGGINNFIVQDDIGCQGTVSISIFEPTVLNLSATQDSASCFGIADGAINLSVLGGTMPYVYAVDDISTTQMSPSFTSYEAATYMTYVVDANGCIDSVAQAILEADTIIVNNIITDSVICFGDADGQISFNATGGVTAYTYSIDGGASFLATNTFTVDTGTYSLMIADAVGCLSEMYTTSVFQPTDLELDSVNAVMTNCGLANGSLEVLASGGIAPYAYSLNGGTGQTSGIFNNLAAMTHTVVVTDANNCSETINVIVDSIPNLSLSVMSFDSVSCGSAADASVTVQASGGETAYMYTVNGGAAQANGTFTGLSGGNNVFVVSDNIGNCTATQTVNIYEPTTLSLSAVQDSVSCNSFADGQITLTANGGGANYLYALNDTSSVQFSNIFTGLSVGIDTAYVVDENGCIASVIQAVLEPDTLIITNVNAVDISCSADGSFAVDAQGGTTPYLYNIDGGTTQNTNIFTITSGGTYTLGVTDANGCPTATMIDSIVAPDPVTFVIDSATAALTCHNQNDAFIGITASGGSGPYTYAVNGGAFQADSFFANLAAGSYTILVQDIFNCESAPTTVSITQPNALAGTKTATGVSCFGAGDGTITINTITGGTAPYTVIVDGVTNTYTANMVFTNLAAGNYPILITDDNGCNLTLNETVGDVTALTLNSNMPTNVSCFGAADGEISVVTNGGTPNYDFTITLGAFTETINSASSATFSNLEGSEMGLTYTLSVVDANGCSTSLTESITQPNQLIIEGIDTSALSCFAASDATLSVRATGGSAPYSYLWTPTDQTASLATGLAPGVYSVAVTDANDCTVSSSQTILDVAPVLATITPDSAHISMGDTLNVGVAVENAIGSVLQYAWSPAEGLSCTDCANPAVTVYNDIAYSVIVTDENGCSSFNFTEVYVRVEDSLFYFIPNAFSPGKDGINDAFKVFGQDIKSVSLMVFNRWGEKVFEGANQFVSWDGTFKGELQDAGIYSYVVSITFLNDEEVVKQGSVTLLR